jgi:hypothetical protein
MAEHSSIMDAAQAYLSAGLCVLPAIRAEKRPAIGRWKQYQTRRPTEAELSAWFAKHPDAVCILCGVVSGNAEMIDFDGGGELFDAWCKAIPAELLRRLVIEASPSGGWHVVYRCICAICGNLKLAQRKDGEKIVTLIETRGEGGLFLCAPTPGYELMQGDLCDLPVLTAKERDILLQAAWALNEYQPPVAQGRRLSANRGEMCASVADNGNLWEHNSHNGPLSEHNSHNGRFSAENSHNRDSLAHNSNNGQLSEHNSHNGRFSAHNADRPGDDFNNRGDVRAVLDKHGWVRVREGENEHWRRPGKDFSKRGWSATLKDRVFYVFSSNAAPFEPNQGYSPFSVYTWLEHDGDFEQAARSLRELGYGGDYGKDNADGLDISAIVGMSVAQGASPPHNSDKADNGPKIQKLKTLITEFAGLNAPIIHGLLREGETMNIIASPKIGKSWFASRLAISVASGLDWLGLTVESGNVLHIDNELHANTIGYRYGVISEAMNFPHHLYSENIDMVSLRGKLRDLYGLARTFDQIEPGQYKLIILDAFYRTLPRDTDENDNGAIANLYNVIDHYASRLRCAFVLIHHTSKGNQSGKAVTDVGAGAGSQSRAADTHLILRPHEEEGIIVLESAVRSWPPMEPKALQWKWPLFTPTDEVDTSALQGMNKPGKSKAVELEDFVEQCIALSDPCSKRSVCYEANQRFGLSERKAEETLNLAMERGLVFRIRTGSHMRYVKHRPGVSGDKAMWTAALLAHNPDGNVSEIAQTVGASERYVRQIRNENPGLTAELGAELALENKGLTAELKRNSAELSSGNTRN